MASCTDLPFFFLISIFCCGFASADSLTFYFPTNRSLFWTNNDLVPAFQFFDCSIARFILLHGGGVFKIHNALGYGCGFFCSSVTGDACQFAILLVETTQLSIFAGTAPQVAWSANRDNPVGHGSTLEFWDGTLILRDSSGILVWSSNTSSESVVGMSIANGPNLVLFDGSNGTVWQSFDHPTDTLISGQELRVGQSLTSSPLSANLGSGLFSLSIAGNSLTAFVHSDISIPCMSLWSSDDGRAGSFRGAMFQNGLIFILYGTADKYSEQVLLEPQWLPASDFLRLDPDGDLRIYNWAFNDGWRVVYAVMERRDSCLLPLRCGRYGVCTRGQCSCPQALDGVGYFSPLNAHSPELGYAQSPELGCTQTGSQSLEDEYQLVDFGNLSYFSYADPQTAVPWVQDVRECKAGCLRNRSCRAAFFTYKDNASNGLCYLPSDIMSMKGEVYGETKVSLSNLKVGVLSSPPPSSLAQKSVFGIMTAAAIFPSVLILLLLLWKSKVAQSKEDVVEIVPGLPTRFSYKEICIMTGDFAQEIGRGGFGFVFRGVLKDGTQVAVKKLRNGAQGMEEFLAEVQTIGSIHHINMVKFIGFCGEKSHRVLVFEYMGNESLDNWIFGNKKDLLDWQTKLRIMMDVAKGLAYLHEECSQRIAHLDVKPRNVLLDDKFNAKISDFGLSKFIDRDRSEITSSIRGTIGYLAPEWQHTAYITVKADVYSFDIVLFEILCGRRNLDYSQNDSEIHLLSLVHRKAEENRIFDLVHMQREEMERFQEQVPRVMRLGVWCVSFDYKTRPSMSTAVKVLEGSEEVDGPISFYSQCTMVPASNTQVILSPHI